MKKIETLTPGQIARFPEFIEKWTAIGLSTQPANRVKAEHGIRLAYEAAKLPPPNVIVWCGSPLSQALTRAVLLDKKVKIGNSVRDSVLANVHASVRDSIHHSVHASVHDSVLARVCDSVLTNVHDSIHASIHDSVHASIHDSVLASVRNSVLISVHDSIHDSVHAKIHDSVLASVCDSVLASVRDSIHHSVHASIHDSVLASVRDSVLANVRDSIHHSVHASIHDSVLASVRAGYYYWYLGAGQHDAPLFSYLDFMREALGLIEQTDKAEGSKEMCLSAGWHHSYTRICWISERHTILCRNTRGHLHAIDGPAVAYPDGWEIYALNGVRVPEELVKTPSDQLDVVRWCTTKETNAEIRREAVRKIGIETVCKRLGTQTLDKKGDYELIVFDIGDGRARPHLKMKNPSIGVYHIEGVAPHIKTVQQALNWRAGDEKVDWEPTILT